MRYKTYIVGASLLVVSFILVGCSNRPVDAYDICHAATEGLPWNEQTRRTRDECQGNVSWAAYKAAHAAAKPYRDIVR